MGRERAGPKCPRSWVTTDRRLQGGPVDTGSDTGQGPREAGVGLLIQPQGHPRPRLSGGMKAPGMDGETPQKPEQEGGGRQTGSGEGRPSLGPRGVLGMWA